METTASLTCSKLTKSPSKLYLSQQIKITNFDLFMRISFSEYQINSNDFIVNINQNTHQT